MLASVSLLLLLPIAVCPINAKAWVLVILLSLAEDDHPRYCL